MLPLQHPVPPLYNIPLKEAHHFMDELCMKHNIELMIVSAQDEFLSEYSTLSNNQRYALSRFTGSTGDGIFLAPQLRTRLKTDACFNLFVDGRYHLQADTECPQGGPVTVTKLTLSQPLEDSMLEWIENCGAETLTIGFDGARSSYLRAKKIAALCAKKSFQFKNLLAGEVSKALCLPGWKTDRIINALPFAATGRDVFLNFFALSDCLPPNACFVTCATDDAAWLTNTRGYHMPNASSVMAYTFSFKDHLVVYLNESSENCIVSLAAQESRGSKVLNIKVVRNNLTELKTVLLGLGVADVIAFNEQSMNAALPALLQDLWPKVQLKADFKNLVTLRAQKTTQEQDAFRSAFLKSSAAIAATLRWAKLSVAEKKPISEWDLAERIGEEYAIRGAKEQSFRPIAGTGAMSAVIHYGTPSKQRPLIPGDLALLDSGAYYAEGLATDCTRVAYCNGGTAAEDWQKQIYTVTLKACIAGMAAEFPASELGSQLDAKVRGVCDKYGYSFAHGTGHGVGILVHEGGVGISTRAQSVMPVGAVCSVEPGIYLADKGGVRLENVVIVQKHPTRSGYLHFENLVYVGYDWDLIDLNLLTPEEKTYLKTYEKKCAELGNQINTCPL